MFSWKKLPFLQEKGKKKKMERLDYAIYKFDLIGSTIYQKSMEVADLELKINEAEKQLKKLQKENRKRELNHMMYGIMFNGEGTSHLSEKDRTDLFWLSDEIQKDIEIKIDALKNNDNNNDNNNNNKAVGF